MLLVRAYGAVMKTGLALNAASANLPDLTVRFVDANVRHQHNSMLLACAYGFLSSVSLFFMLPPSDH